MHTGLSNLQPNAIANAIPFCNLLNLGVASLLLLGMMITCFTADLLNSVKPQAFQISPMLLALLVHYFQLG